MSAIHLEYMWWDIRDTEWTPEPCVHHSHSRHHSEVEDLLKCFNIISSWSSLRFVFIHIFSSCCCLSTLWQLCSQCLGASFPTPDAILPGLLPLMPRHSPLKGKTVGTGLQNIMHGHDLLPYSNNESQFHRTHKSDCRFFFLLNKFDALF